MLIAHYLRHSVKYILGVILEAGVPYLSLMLFLDLPECVVRLLL